MQLPLTAGVLVPLGVGAVVVIIALVVLIVRARRKRRRASPDVADVVTPPEPTESDWTGEAIYAPPPPSRSTGAHPVTVAEAMAGWKTEKPPVEEPLPPALDAMLTPQAPDAVVPVQREPAAMGLAEAAALPLFAGPAGQAAKPATAAAEQQPAPAADPAEPADADAAAGEPAPVDEPSHPTTIPAGPWARSPQPQPPPDVTAPEPPQPPPAQPRPPDTRPASTASGSSRTVAAAVAQALAVRAAAGRPAGAEAAATPPPAAPRGDARDRLLAVLLNDPVRAVGAAVELESCREQLDRLTHAVSFERGRLGEVLGKLAGAGLRPDQLARLAGLPLDEVRELLPEPEPEPVPQRGA